MGGHDRHPECAQAVRRLGDGDEAGVVLRATHRRGARIATFCSGAFVLAAAGLLDGRQATTHWTHADEFRERFPDVELDPNVLYVGGDRLFTSAGTAAGIDLCLHLVRSDRGAEVANAVARRMVVPPHRDGGQAQFVEVPVPSSDDADADLRAVLRWVEGNLDRGPQRGRARPAGGDDARGRSPAASSSRPGRHRCSGCSTSGSRRRSACSRRRALGVDEIAASCGFGSAAALRQHFGRLVGSTPSGYRPASIRRPERYP